MKKECMQYILEYLYPDKDSSDTSNWIVAEGRIVFWNTDIGTQPTTSELDAAEEDAIDAWMVKRIRKIRDMKLAETDWWSSSDRTITDEQKAYRQKLRDMPATASPELDEYWDLTGVTWPEKPE